MREREKERIIGYSVEVEKESMWVWEREAYSKVTCMSVWYAFNFANIKLILCRCRP